MTPEHMDNYFDGLINGPGRTNRHYDNSAFFMLRDSVAHSLSSYVLDTLAGSVSWSDPQNRNHTIWKLSYYDNHPWLFGVRRERARHAPELHELLTHQFGIQGVPFVGIAVKGDDESRAAMAALVQAVHENEAACEFRAARLTTPLNVFKRFHEWFTPAANSYTTTRPFAIYSRNWSQITGDDQRTLLDNWLRLAPPAGRAAQWRDGRSAKELARYWHQRDPNTPVLPQAIGNVLADWKFMPSFGVAEFRGGLDGFVGNTRNHDLLLPGVSQADNTKTLVSVEAKADESFGELICDYRRAGEAKDGSRIPDRIDRLVRSLFWEQYDISSLRYQLLHAIGSTLIDAHRFGCQRALFLVHEFRSRQCSEESLRRNAADLEAFIRRLVRNGQPELASPSLQAPYLVGPFRVPGDPPDRVGGYLLPSDIPLFIGKVVTQLD